MLETDELLMVYLVERNIRFISLGDNYDSFINPLSVLELATSPRMITIGKIPDAHIIFLDETFKCNDGVLNANLTAMNERKYTNESETLDIPAISFIGASNEIPDFNDKENEILRPLYDRFDLKIVTQDIASREERQRILSRKQRQAKEDITATISYSCERRTTLAKNILSGQW